jgi:hypothetical protein
MTHCHVLFLTLANDIGSAYSTILVPDKYSILLTIGIVIVKYLSVRDVFLAPYKYDNFMTIYLSLIYSQLKSK